MDIENAVNVSILCGILVAIITFKASYKLINSNGRKKYKRIKAKVTLGRTHNRVHQRRFSYRVISITLLIIFLLLIIPITFLFNNLLKHEVSGLHTTCYTTRTGECYHADYCGYLHSSSYKTNVYKAQKNGYRDCSRCYVGELDTSIKDEYFYSFLISSTLCMVAFLIIYLPIKKHHKKINYQQQHTYYI